MRFFLGLMFIILSLPMLWMSQSQNRAETFSSAQRVSVDQKIDGFVVVEGSPTVTAPLFCSIDTTTECLYDRVTTQEYQQNEFTQCGDVVKREGVNLLKQVEDKCTETGSCQDCYLYQETGWKTVSDNKHYAEIHLGSYRVQPSASAMFIGLQTSGADVVDNQFNTTNTQSAEPIAVGTVRTRMEYLPKQNALLVAGKAIDGYIGATGSELFVISNESYGQTAVALTNVDTAARWGLMIGSMILMVLGFVFFVSQFAAPLAGLFRVLPFVGGPIAHGAQGLVYMVVAVAAALIWIVCLGVVMLAKNIFLAALVLVGVAALVVYLVRSQKGLKKI